LINFIDFSLCAQAFCHVRVVGNLAIVARPIGHAGTEAAPLQSMIGDLWCGIEKVGEPVPIEHAEFTRLKDGKTFEAKIKDNKAKLHFGKSPATVAGKYMCEVRSAEGEQLKGNLIVYSPPFLRLKTGSIFYEVPGARPPKVVGGVKKAARGGRIELLCPVLGYPQPFVRWEKDGKPIESDTIEYDGDNLILTSVESSMNGVYTCIADNSFPMFVDGPAMPYQLKYDQEVMVEA
uniref:Ig-like domain-containing protein n=1 Tax=Heligmosomoides polygyrus TaxID=6339 RepID=A0A183FNP9_HELPZ